MDTAEVFNDSFGRIATDLTGFFGVFYDKFMASSPEVARQFEGVDMDRQMRMLEQSFITLANLSAMKNFDQQLDKLKAHHQKLGLKSEMFDHWLDAMIEALAETDPKFSEKVEVAWRTTLTPGLQYMKD